MRTYFFILSIIVSVGGAGTGNSQERQKSDQIDIGKIEFERNCSICHGSYGRGDGPYLMLSERMPVVLYRWYFGAFGLRGSVCVLPG